MYAICQVRTVPNAETGKNDFEPDITPLMFKDAIYAPTLSDQPGNRKAKNWCIVWLTDPANTTGNLLKITESVGSTFWGDLNNGRKNQILNALSANQIDSTFITDQMTLLEIINHIAQELQAGKQYVASN